MTYQKKKDILQNLRENAGALQRSDEWYETRKLTLGGSEIASVIGVGYSGIKQLLATKIGLSKFSGNIYTRWGKLFEPVSSVMISRIFNVAEGDMIDGDDLGSIPYPGNDRLRYSPDGIFICEIKGKHYMVLLEIKSPFSSIPNGKIPPKYIPQPKMGMVCVPGIDFALFVNNLFRKCQIGDLFNNKYDTSFHRDKEQFTDVFARGIIQLYQTEEQRNKLCEIVSIDDESDYNSDMENLSEIPPPPPTEDIYTRLYNRIYTDFGHSDFYEMGILLSFIEDGYISTDFSSFEISSDFIDLIQKKLYQRENTRSRTQIDYSLCNEIMLKLGKKQETFIADTEEPSTNTQEKKYEVGILPWKLYRSDIIKCKKDCDFIENNMEAINYFFYLLDSINASSDKVAKYNEMTTNI